MMTIIIVMKLDRQRKREIHTHVHTHKIHTRTHTQLLTTVTTTATIINDIIIVCENQTRAVSQGGNRRYHCVISLSLGQPRPLFSRPPPQKKSPLLTKPQSCLLRNVDLPTICQVLNDEYKADLTESHR